jgi:hypothetical protein
MRILLGAVLAALLAMGSVSAVPQKSCTELFTPNDFLSVGCKISGSSLQTQDFSKVCSNDCVQGLHSYTLALKSSCGAKGAELASEIESHCSAHGIKALFTDSDPSCFSYVKPNDFLKGGCRVQGSRISAAEYSKVCSRACAQDLKTYEIALNSTCNAASDPSGHAEVQKIQAACLRL